MYARQLVDQIHKTESKLWYFVILKTVNSVVAKMGAKLLQQVVSFILISYSGIWESSWSCFRGSKANEVRDVRMIIAFSSLRRKLRKFWGVIKILRRGSERLLNNFNAADFNGISPMPEFMTCIYVPWWYKLLVLLYAYVHLLDFVEIFFI